VIALLKANVEFAFKIRSVDRTAKLERKVTEKKKTEIRAAGKNRWKNWQCPKTDFSTFSISLELDTYTFCRATAWQFCLCVIESVTFVDCVKMIKYIHHLTVSQIRKPIFTTANDSNLWSLVMCVYLSAI